MQGEKRSESGAADEAADEAAGVPFWIAWERFCFCGPDVPPKTLLVNHGRFEREAAREVQTFRPNFRPLFRPNSMIWDLLAAAAATGGMMCARHDNAS